MVRLCPDKRMLNPSPAYTVQLSLEKGDALDLAYTVFPFMPGDLSE